MLNVLASRKHFFHQWINIFFLDKRGFLKKTLVFLFTFSCYLCGRWWFTDGIFLSLSQSSTYQTQIIPVEFMSERRRLVDKIFKQFSVPLDWRIYLIPSLLLTCPAASVCVFIEMLNILQQTIVNVSNPRHSVNLKFCATWVHCKLIQGFPKFSMPRISLWLRTLFANL